jgi:hypothetical protein
MLGALALGVPVASAAGPVAPSFVNSVSNQTTLAGATSVAVSGNFAYTTAFLNGTLTALDVSNPATPTIVGASAVANSLFGGTTVNIANGYAYVASKNLNGPCLPGPAPACSGGSNDQGTGNSLTVLDIHTNPAVPAIVGTLTDPANLFGAFGLAVQGNKVFIASQGETTGQPQLPDTSTGAFSVIDVSNPAAPTIVGHLENSTLQSPYAGTNALEHADAVAVSGNYAYVAAGYANRLTVINITNPTNPYIMSSLSDNTNLASPSDIQVVGNYAYIADQTGNGSEPNFTIVDISNPVHPVVVGTVIDNAALSGAYRLRVQGNFAYVAASNQSAVAVIDISNPANPRVLGYVQSTSGINSPIGLDLADNGGYVLASSVHAAGETTPRYPPYTPTTGTIAAIEVDPVLNGVAISTSSEPPNGTAHTTANFSFATTDQVATVACQLDGSPLGYCTSGTNQQYSGLTVGNHTFTVQTTDSMGNVTSASYTWRIGAAPPPTFAPKNTAAPGLSGTDAIGQKLTCSQGTWTGTAPISYSYAWTRGGTAIAGATRATYVIQSADARQHLGCSVKASNAVGSATATSGLMGAPAGSAKASHAQVLKNRAVKVTVTCAKVAGTSCRVALTLSRSGRNLASSSFTLGAGKHKTLKFKLNHAALALLMRLHKLPTVLALYETGSNHKTAKVSTQKVTFFSV